MEAIPIVDLRLLTQAEINALSRASSSSASGAGEPRRFDDLVVPKIDRSVFNESAGSRKQTYSRLRLAPRKPPDLSPSPSSSSARPSRPSTALVPALPPPPAPAAADDTGRRENEQIIFFLRQLFAKKGVDIGGASTADHDESTAVVIADAVANPSLVGTAVGKRGKEQEAAEPASRDGDVLNVHGAAVDLVGLGEMEDPFGPEMRRRTHGLVTEEEFLGFLNRLEGQWGSRRKRRRIVDAGVFGDALPKGWKLLLALKRKDSNIWLHCRRYISPSGKQFMSCKEVSLYLLSSDGSHNVRQQNAAQNSTEKLGNGYAVGHNPQMNATNRSPSCSSMMPISALVPESGKQIVLYGTENPTKPQLQDVLKCQECNLGFADKTSPVQHLLSFHGSSKKRRRVGQSICDGVIIRDGKYECQFCHKTFTERHRYNGHVGIHVKYHDRSLELVKNEIIMEKNVPSSSRGAASTLSEHSNLVDFEEKAKLIEENMDIKPVHEINDPHANEHVGNNVSDHTSKSCDNDREKIMSDEICNLGSNGEIRNCFPQKNNCDYDKVRDVMQETCPSANRETNNGSTGSNIFIEERENDVMKCFDNERNSVQDVYNAQCDAEINASFHPSNSVNKVNSSPEFNIETSGGGLFKIDYGSAEKTPRESADSGNIRNGDITAFLDCISPSHTDNGNCTFEGSSNIFIEKVLDEMERSCKLNIGDESNSFAILQGGQPSVKVTHTKSSGSVVNEIENKICLDNDLNTLVGTEQRATTNAAAICIAEEFVEMVKSGNEPENYLKCANKASDGTVIVENIAHGEMQLSGNSVMVPSAKMYCNVKSTRDDMLPGSGEELMLEIMGQSRNKLKDDLMKDGASLSTGAPRSDSHIADEANMQTLQVNMQASWEQTSAHLPMLHMIDQGNGHLYCANGANHQEISCFEDMRLDDVDPGKLVISAGGDSRHRLVEPMPGATGLENGPSPCVQLGWESVFPNLSLRGRFTTVCVWCSSEFEHDDLDIEVQPDSVGLMCPTCKAKISGQI